MDHTISNHEALYVSCLLLKMTLLLL